MSVIDLEQRQGFFSPNVGFLQPSSINDIKIFTECVMPEVIFQRETKLYWGAGQSLEQKQVIAL